MTTVSTYLTTMSMGGMLMTMTETTTLGAATATSTSSSSSSMDMDMDMSMNTYFSSTWKDYPIIFDNLQLSNGGKLFGIFLLLFVVGFLFRGLGFLSLYLEQKVFHNYNNAVIVEVEDNCECGDDEDDQDDDGKSSNGKLNALSRGGKKSLKISKWRQFLLPGTKELAKDFVRLLVAFVTAMFGYVLMIAAMSYVILYFFAVVLGIAFGEVFFNRVGIVIGVNKNSALCSALH